MTAHRLKMRREAQKKHGKGAALNLVSLMDIFTILVFFLMANSSEVEVLQTNTKIKLPDSVSEQKPKNQLMILVTHDDIVVQGRPVARVADAAPDSVKMIEGLRTELAYQAERKGPVPEAGYDVTIMGDREIPYWLMKKIMVTCQDVDFAHISLAVNQLETGGKATAADLAASAAAAPGGGRS
jgi:biopolymer transport protein TolR